MMGMEPGTRLYIATPIQVRDYIKSIPPGETRTLGRLRLDLAAANGADTTCPLTCGIFARIAAEAALDELSCGAPESAIAPFWRLIDPKSPLARKLSCGPDFIQVRLDRELRQKSGTPGRVESL